MLAKGVGADGTGGVFANAGELHEGFGGLGEGVVPVAGDNLGGLAEAFGAKEETEGLKEIGKVRDGGCG